jgi:CRISPR-associated protein Cas2
VSIYVVCYDITDDDARDRVRKTLGEYGERVQYSVFEIMLRSEVELEHLRERLQAVAGTALDVRFYRLCERCRAESQTLAGDRVAVFPSTIIV